jgi:hypothetical protein
VRRTLKQVRGHIASERRGKGRWLSAREKLLTEETRHKKKERTKTSVPSSCQAQSRLRWECRATHARRSGEGVRTSTSEQGGAISISRLERGRGHVGTERERAYRRWHTQSSAPIGRAKACDVAPWAGQRKGATVVELEGAGYGDVGERAYLAGVLKTAPLVVAVTTEAPRMYRRHAAQGCTLGATTACAGGRRGFAACRAASNSKSRHGAHPDSAERERECGRPLTSQDHNTWKKR